MPVLSALVAISFENPKSPATLYFLITGREGRRIGLAGEAARLKAGANRFSLNFALITAK